MLASSAVPFTLLLGIWLSQNASYFDQNVPSLAESQKSRPLADTYSGTHSVRDLPSDEEGKRICRIGKIYKLDLESPSAGNLTACQLQRMGTTTVEGVFQKCKTLFDTLDLEAFYQQRHDIICVKACQDDREFRELPCHEFEQWEKKIIFTQDIPEFLPLQWGFARCHINGDRMILVCKNGDAIPETAFLERRSLARCCERGHEDNFIATVPCDDYADEMVDPGDGTFDVAFMQCLLRHRNRRKGTRIHRRF